MKTFFVVSCLLVLPLFSQSLDETPIAKVGSIVITQKEFLSRYELTPGLYRQKTNLETNKTEFLLSMIAEKLLVVKAQQLGLDRDTVFVNAIRDVERLLVRDELYRREISQKVSLSEQEITAAMQRSLIDVKVYFLYAKTKEGADFLFTQIQQGKPLESFSFVNDTTGEFEGPDSAIARWGDVDERMEQVIYSLKPNQTSKPVHLDDGWYIVKFMGKTVTIVEGEKEKKAMRERVEQTLRRRKELLRMTEFMNAELRETRTDVNARLLKSVVFHLWHLAQQRFPRRSDSAIFFIDHAAVESLRVVMGDSMMMRFVTFPHTTWSVEETLEKIRITNLAIPNPSLRKIRADVEQRLRDIIDQEYITDIGYKKKLHQSAAVRKDVKVWREAYMAQHLRDVIGDTISVEPWEVEEIRTTLHNDTSIVNNTHAAEAKMKEIKTAESLSRFVGAAANTTEIIIYKNNIDAMKVTATPSMVFRFLGFGGRMFAVPFVVPHLGWINYWNGKNVKLP
jgi:hypothetical protein